MGLSDKHYQVKSVNCDNASNNDTMMDHLERLHEEDGYEFDTTEARLRCMPHTVHLSALEVSVSGRSRCIVDP